MLSRDRAGQQGAVLALVAIGAIALLGAVGLAVDGSRMLEERRHAQAAADHAATAAAHSRCTATTGTWPATAVAAGQAAALANGFNDAASDVVVAITPVGTPATTYDYNAVITSTIDGTFSRVLGFNTFNVSAEATSSGTGCQATGGGAGPGAIYGGGTCPSGKYGIDVSGSNNDVYGGVHTNDDSRVGGGGNDFDDEAQSGDYYRYVGSHSGTGDYEAGNPAKVSAPSPVWPSGWLPTDFTGATTGDPGAGTFLKPYYDLAGTNGTRFTSKVDSITKNGVYYTTATDGMDIGSVSAGVTHVVLVATRGPIKISVSSRTFNPYDHASITKKGLLMVSGLEQSSSSGFTERCDKYTIAISGSSSTWNGILWGRGGLIELSGSSNTAVNGSAIGWAIRLNGSDLVIRYNAALFPGGAEPTIILLK